MTELYIPNLSVPPEIKLALTNLSAQYAIEREVTKGANGFLFFGTNRVLNTKIAIKIYYWGSDSAFHAEPQNLAQIASANVIPVTDAAYIDDRWAYFVTPYCSGGDLDDLLERSEIGNVRALKLVADILSGLSHLHAQRLLHRDLKPSNIYISESGGAVIGDFGSIKKMPQGHNSIPASSNSVLYRPPESLETNEYGFAGDIYQTGMTLYQLLGGYLPYEETAWLTKQELAHFTFLQGPADRSIYLDQCIHARIRKGKVVNTDSLPPWVCDSLKRVVRKACHLTKEQRFESAAHFLAKLNEISAEVRDWQVVRGHPTLIAPTSYRVVAADGNYQAQKRSASVVWRNDRSILKPSLKEAIDAINQKN